MKARFWIASLLIVFSLALVNGCGSDKAQKQETTTPKVQEQTKAVEPQEPATIDTAYIESVLAKGAKLEGITFKLIMTAGGQTTQTNCWAQGKKSKLRGVVEGKEQVTIIDETSIISYSPADKTGTKMVLEKGQDSGESPLESYNDSTLTFLEKGNYDGEECYIVSAKDKEDGSVMKLWVSKKLGLPIKSESKAEGLVFVSEMKEIKVGKLPSNTFEVPVGINITTP